MYEIDVQNEGGFSIDEARLREAVTAALRDHKVAEGTALTIVVTTNEAVAELNHDHRGIDAPTDILSFPAPEPPVQIPGEPPYLGDMVIAYPYASAQAEREGHDLSDSLALLVVHSALHLLGYDHDTPENKAQMWAAQEKILRVIGVPLDIVPALEGNHDE